MVIRAIAGEKIEIGDAVAFDPETGKLRRAIAGRDQPTARAAEEIRVGDMVTIADDPVLGAVIRKSER